MQGGVLKIGKLGNEYLFLHPFNPLEIMKYPLFISQYY